MRTANGFPLRGRVVFVLFAALCVSGLSATLTRAQTTSTISSLYLSNESELNFGLYGTNGGAGTNGLNSDQIDVTGAFDYSSSASGTYIVGFTDGDGEQLTPSSIFTLVTFDSTNFTAAEATDFRAVPQGNVEAISGSFLLNTVNGGGGTLQFVLSSDVNLPEPSALVLLAVSSLPLTAMKLAPQTWSGWISSRNRHG